MEDVNKRQQNVLSLSKLECGPYTHILQTPGDGLISPMPIRVGKKLQLQRGTCSSLCFIEHSLRGRRNQKSKDDCKADRNNVYYFFITIFRLAIPAFFRFTGSWGRPFHFWGEGGGKGGMGDLASPQTSFGVRLSRIHFYPMDRGGEMNAWQTNPKGRLRGGYGWSGLGNNCFPIAPYQYATVTIVVISSLSNITTIAHRLSSIVQNPSSGF